MAPTVAAAGVGALALVLTRLPDRPVPLGAATPADRDAPSRAIGAAPALAPLAVESTARTQPRPPGGPAPASPAGTGPPEPARRFTVRVIAFHGNEGGRARAEGIQGYLESRGWSCVARQAGWHWVVEVGAFADYRTAESALAELATLTTPHASFADAFILRRPIGDAR